MDFLSWGLENSSTKQFNGPASRAIELFAISLNHCQSINLTCNKIWLYGQLAVETRRLERKRRTEELKTGNCMMK